MESNELNEIKIRISNETGVPVELLDGETEEDNRSRALALIAFKNEYGSEAIDIHKKEAYLAEQWGMWIKSRLG